MLDDSILPPPCTATIVPAASSIPSKRLLLMLSYDHAQKQAVRRQQYFAAWSSIADSDDIARAGKTMGSIPLRKVQCRHTKQTASACTGNMKVRDPVNTGAAKAPLEPDPIAAGLPAASAAIAPQVHKSFSIPLGKLQQSAASKAQSIAHDQHHAHASSSELKGMHAAACSLHSCPESMWPDLVSFESAALVCGKLTRSLMHQPAKSV